MLNRSSIFALAAVAAIAAAALAPTSASAMRGGFGGGGFGGGHSFGGGGVGRSASFGRISSVGRGPIGGGRTGGFGHFHDRLSGNTLCAIDRCGPPRPPCFVRCGGHLPPPIVWWHHPHHDWYVGWHHPHFGVADVPAAVDTAVDTAAVPAAPCNCLTKQYLDDGSVLFQDICTKEAALATPDELKAQAQGAAPTQTTTR
jgi:hypothetical protein